MPQVTVYIREQDLEKWKALQKKSEFIHNALNAGRRSTSSTSVNTSSIDHPEHIETPTYAEAIQSIAKAQDRFIKTDKVGRIIRPKLCKHGISKGSCMHKEATRLKCNV